MSRAPLPGRILLLAGSLSTLLLLAATPLRTEGGVEPPREGDTPVALRAGVRIVDVTRISEVENTFDVEVDYRGQWFDGRLAFEPEPGESAPRVYQGAAAEAMRTSTWWPQLAPVNQVGALSVVSQRFVIHPDGNAVVHGRIAVRLKAPLDFRRFPFDTQTLAIHVQPFAWSSDDVWLEVDESATGISADLRLPEWEVLGVRTSTSAARETSDGIAFSRLTTEVDIRRRSGFFVWKVMLPLVTIVALSWCVFWMTGIDLARRAGVSVTGILTVVAYQFIASESLPRVAYLTIMDKMMLCSFVTIAATMVVNVAATRERAIADGRAARLDRWSRVLFPLGYAASIVVLALTTAAS